MLRALSQHLATASLKLLQQLFQPLVFVFALQSLHLHWIAEDD